MQLAPKSVLITGANRGIGLELVRQLVKLPSPPEHVFATCRTPETATDLQAISDANKTVKVMKLDVSQLDDLPGIEQKVSEAVGKDGLNLLINNAGTMQRCSLEDVTEQAMMDHFKINTIAPLMITKAFLPLLKKAAATMTSGLNYQRAMVINMTSKMGSIDDNTSGGSYAYRASKNALNMVTKCLSHDFVPEGILTMAVHPGWVQTDMGGPRALITTEECVTSMLKIFANASEKHAGVFIDYKGEIIPW